MFFTGAGVGFRQIQNTGAGPGPDSIVFFSTGAGAGAAGAGPGLSKFTHTGAGFVEKYRGLTGAGAPVGS